MKIDLGGSAATPFDAVLYARTTCGDDTSEVKCSDSFTDGGEEITFPVTAGTTYYLFVDGYSGASGTYTINVTVTPPGCGDGALDTGEECDDGNVVSNDGCSSACVLESAGAGDLCPGTNVTLALSGTNWVGTASGSTASLYPSYSGTCGSATSSKDIVYHFNSGVGGKTTVALPTASFDTVLYVRSGACATGTEMGCNDTSGSGGETLTFNAPPNTDYWVFVDGYAGESGTFDLSVTVMPAACGNGSVEGTETCDDGNTAANDGCSANCQWEGTCGAIAEVEPNPFDTPQTIAAACRSFQVVGAALPLNDADYFKFDLTAGQIVTASTFVGAVGQCIAAADTVLSLYQSPIATVPNETGGCGTSGYLECNDTDSANSPCSTITFTAATTGSYVLKVHNYFSTGPIVAYGLNVTVK